MDIRDLTYRDPIRRVLEEQQRLRDLMELPGRQIIDEARRLVEGSMIHTLADQVAEQQASVRGAIDLVARTDEGALAGARAVADRLAEDQAAVHDALEFGAAAGALQEAARMFEESLVGPRVRLELEEAERLRSKLQDVALVDGLAAAMSGAEPLQRRWREMNQGLEGSFQSVAEIVADRAAEIVSSLEQAVAVKIEWDALTQLSLWKYDEADILKGSFRALTASIDDLYASQLSFTETIALDPPAIGVWPAEEFLWSATAMGVVARAPWQESDRREDSPTGETDTTEDLESLASYEEESEIVRYHSLDRIHPRLPRVIRGALGAARSNNPDRTRHVVISLREALGVSLRHLAPTEGVLQWITDATLLHEGRPTRRGRILYIARRVQTEEVREFIEADARTVMKLIDLLNRLTHDMTHELTELELNALIAKVVGFLRYLIILVDEQAPN